MYQFQIGLKCFVLFFVIVKYIHENNVIFDKTISKLVTILNPTSYLKTYKTVRQKILMDCTLIIVCMIFSEGFTSMPLYSKHNSRKN